MYIKAAYTVFIGILLAAFVGVGIAAFYPSPKAPEYYSVAPKPLTATESAIDRETQFREQQTMQSFHEVVQEYNRNVATLALAGAIIILIVSLTIVRNVPLIADGMMLGGVLTLIYSIVRGFGSQDMRFQFAVISVGLLIAVILGYIKFIKPTTQR